MLRNEVEKMAPKYANKYYVKVNGRLYSKFEMREDRMVPSKHETRRTKRKREALNNRLIKQAKVFKK